jgi:DNA polymerase-1
MLVKHEMEHVIELTVPIVADAELGANWRDL